MALLNENYLKTPEIYCFDDVEKRVNAYKLLHPKAKLIRLGIGDVTRPVPSVAINAMHTALDELSLAETFRGYSPPKGYDFLIEKIVREYRSKGININKEAVFINDGAKSDIGNIGHILGRDNIIAIADPVYPVYENATIMSGRAGYLNEDRKWSNVVYLKCNEQNDFVPELPTEKVDVIYLCSPNNPTGTTISKTEMKMWVDYALEHNSIIIFDAAYQAYITQDDVPVSIYEIKNAKKIAIEIRSFSKSAGFTGLRCGFSIFPQELTVRTQMGEAVPLIKLWSRRNANYTNGISYVVQRGAEALFSRKGKQEIRQLIDYYMTNARMIREELIQCGLKVYGGINSPYVWFKTPDNTPSWKFFQVLLQDFQIVGTPGVVFGHEGEGYMRFAGFCSLEETKIALDRIRNRL
ncbi:MAG: LL-diaminopimelate aminotransferase [Paludibacter sp.]|nr:LL-diaminopimelate aminotransferase [Paludibacter sp.]MDD4197883.1 LL-diaminopimelate aminotransferase [Paludibacter sp.]MDD4427564.1 LL-diaminopimelate aminotransferase [Paludibacter sp.]